MSSVVKPGLFEAAVAYSPVSSDAVDNFDKWQRPAPESREILAALGNSQDNPAAWAHAGAYRFGFTQPAGRRRGNTGYTHDSWPK